MTRQSDEAENFSPDAVAGPIRLGQAEWFRRVGEVASSIGTDRFHQLLVELFGATIPHSASWIIRYSRGAPPDVIYTANVPADVVDFYVANCSALDPFSAHWKRYEEPGVRSLASFGARGGPIDPQPYSRLFKAAAKITDELGIFFSTVGHSSLGMFLEREKGRFTEAEIERSRLVFPMLDGFHKTHVGRIFDRLRYAGDVTDSELITRPTLVQDRMGLEIFATPSWREATAADASIAEAVAAATDARSIDLAGHTLKVERFDDYFPLAPAGRMFVLTPRAKAADRAEPDPGLTAREKAVFDLVMAGVTTGAIAQTLEISKGAVKNVKLRIYRKAGVASERALVQKFARARTAE
ncbi:helix-turn-helix domain-containing protein [Chenggangzhangella methanolivorans]|uniref:Helix-turn-helix transcriptional regulator n=1 Tax=Chenggangzhangella methanolivorans TaxID=1437009 RepID=A0A9E6UGJ7_9HYPH|nr:helix-turn-helix transcriptional regulator [Chenggangzhangella methanolivorans]QZN98802.1 helix-turn-helix transcriptional regulator [Chenggangzhangella methanolivorans]